MLNGYDLIGIFIICLTVLAIYCARKNPKFDIGWIVPVSFFVSFSYAVGELAK